MIQMNYIDRHTHTHKKKSDTKVLNENAVLIKPTLDETCLTLFSNNLGRSTNQRQMDFSKQ